MKKILISLGIFASLISVNAQSVEKGNVIIDGFYGFPNGTVTLLKAFAPADVENTISGVGPFGGRVEFMLSEKVGLGVNLTYSNTKIEYSETFFENDGNGGTIERTYDYKVSRPKIVGLARFNFHFFTDENVDAFFGVGAGYRTTTWKYETNDPSGFDEELKGFNPIGFRLAVGSRYFFTDNIGANFEIGLGGPLLSLGASVKF